MKWVHVQGVDFVFTQALGIVAVWVTFRGSFRGALKRNLYLHKFIERLLNTGLTDSLSPTGYRTPREVQFSRKGRLEIYNFFGRIPVAVDSVVSLDANWRIVCLHFWYCSEFKHLGEIAVRIIALLWYDLLQESK